jgi:DNA-binding MarR family transcriptional regulator
VTRFLEKIQGLTSNQYGMLVAANGCSLPGDGLRIKGAGAHRVARTLEAMGFVRVARPAEDGRKARVHVTKEGRAKREAMGEVVRRG